MRCPICGDTTFVVQTRRGPANACLTCRRNRSNTDNSFAWLIIAVLLGLWVFCSLKPDADRFVQHYEQTGR